jgi:hypothetical protein
MPSSPVIETGAGLSHLPLVELLCRFPPRMQEHVRAGMERVCHPVVPGTKFEDAGGGVDHRRDRRLQLLAVLME